jgi:hypothetical protein
MLNQLVYDEKFSKVLDVSPSPTAPAPGRIRGGGRYHHVQFGTR